jgi:hypothetical protein
VNVNDYDLLLASLNNAVEILDANRTADPAFVAAYDTLKQARAMVVEALKMTPEPDLSGARPAAA